MKTTRILLLFLMQLCLVTGLRAQVYMTKAGSVRFDASTPLETISAQNNSSTLALDTRQGNLMANVNIKAFTFKSALMQEHFNENYMESDQYPLATFKGTATLPEGLREGKDGVYYVTCTGTLTVHGVAQPVKYQAVMTMQRGSLRVSGKFKVVLADHKIVIPGLVREKISEAASVDVSAQLEPVKK